MKKPLILGSTSPFRREILEKLNLPFSCEKPEVDETPLENETAYQLVMRLAEAKARAAGQAHSDAWVIGSDQVAVIDDEILGKPGSHEKALEQLSAASGRKVTFYTSLCLLNTQTGESQLDVETFKVYFRTLSHKQIDAYLKAEQPYNCAGSFKSEGLGIALFDRLSGRDPNTLMGLPLIRLIEMLQAEGFDVLRAQAELAS
ncbi:septum formation inhibitor Maf [Ferrimonas sediminicola]|uniref:7-methyl-GTP pyrophosphatase n=1 Tax=Ferrimonas sediminicola TaxID=2569538 RepID=A0A4U1BF61_9GAMM|nr:Maf family protein [Ferrimonas sediminicola]TKB49000.1 septum formation inhibitor Maf [Ferrimonas sediminicola]